MMVGVGALVTLDLPADAPALELPWIITFGPLRDDDEWEPVVCGPYEREHALLLAEVVVTDEDLMAVVEPLVPHLTVDQIRGDIAAARLAAQNEDVETTALDAELAEYEDDLDAFREHDHEHAEDDEPHEPVEPPTVDELKAGFTRIAAKLTG
jgi:hypothetical protein